MYFPLKIFPVLLLLLLLAGCKESTVNSGDNTPVKSIEYKPPEKLKLKDEKALQTSKVDASSLKQVREQKAAEKAQKSVEKTRVKKPGSKPKLQPAKVQPAKVSKVSKTKETSKPKLKPQPKVVAPAKKNVPVVEFNELVYDFGEIKEGDKISHRFNFKNVGSAPLSITAANATCGCTQPSFPFVDINPGENGYIGVDYYSVNKKGDQEPQITILGNMEGGSIVLTLKGYVNPKEEDGEDQLSPSLIDSTKTE